MATCFAAVVAMVIKVRYAKDRNCMEQCCVVNANKKALRIGNAKLSQQIFVVRDGKVYYLFLTAGRILIIVVDIDGSTN